MGYYTTYEVSTEPRMRGEEQHRFRVRFKEQTDYHIDNLQDIKWYNHEDDMRRLSQEFPNHLLILSGEGEESGDIWRHYYLNGKVQKVKAVITYEQFDHSKLV